MIDIFQQFVSLPGFWFGVGAAIVRFSFAK
jgi:hypothetical protein